MKTLAFAKRNFLETIRDPLSLLFSFLFPVFMFVIFGVVNLALPAEAQGNVPQFATSALFTTIPMFSSTFIMLFTSLLVAKDRSTAFLTRLRTSPLKSAEFIGGYFLAMIPVGVCQLIVIALTAICFGYKFTGNSLLSLLLQLPMTLLFIATGLLLGSLLNDKAVGGISSGIITGSVILSGMFMDPSVMASWFTTLMKCLPFYNSITLAKMAETNNWSGSWNYQPAIILVAYIVVITALAVFVFNKKLSSDKQ